MSAANGAVALQTDYLFCPEFDLERVDVVSFSSVRLGETVLSERFDVMSLQPHDVAKQCGFSNHWLVSCCLNKTCLEPEKRFVYKGAPMGLTSNHVGQLLSQGQLCVIKTLPTSEETSNELLVTSPSVRDSPPRNQTGERDFSASDWRTVTVTKIEGLLHLFGRTFVVRRLSFQ